MDIAILCVGALLATAAAWMYLNVQKPKAYEKEENIESNDERPDLISGSQEQNISTNLFVKPTLRRLVFLIVMLLSLCVISVSLADTMMAGGPVLR